MHSKIKIINKRDKIMFIIIMLLIIIGILFRVFFYNGYAYEVSNNREDVAKSYLEQILNCLSDNDEQGLKELFSKRSQSREGFDDEISSAMDFFEGKVVSYSNKIPTKQESTKNGKIIRSTVTLRSDVTTDKNKNYFIIFNVYLVSNGKTEGEKIGISWLNICDMDSDTTIYIADTYQ